MLSHLTPIPITYPDVCNTDIFAKPSVPKQPKACKRHSPHGDFTHGVRSRAKCKTVYYVLVSWRSTYLYLTPIPITYPDTVCNTDIFAKPRVPKQSKACQRHSSHGDFTHGARSRARCKTVSILRPWCQRCPGVSCIVIYWINWMVTAMLIIMRRVERWMVGITARCNC